MKFVVLVFAFCVVPAFADVFRRQKRSIFSTLAENTGAAWSGIADTASNAVKSTVDAATDVHSAVTDHFATVTRGAADTAATVTSSLTDTATDATKGFFNSTANVIDTISDTTANITSTVEDSFTKAVTDVADTVLACDQRLSNSLITKIVSALWNVLSCLVINTVQQLLGTITSIWKVTVAAITTGSRIVTCTNSTSTYTTCIADSMKQFEEDFLTFFKSIPSINDVITGTAMGAGQCVISEIMRAGTIADSVSAAGCRVTAWLTNSE